MIQELVDGDFAFADVLFSLGRLIAFHDQVALEMERINSDIGPADLEPGKGKPARRIDPTHRLPWFRPRGLGRLFREDRDLLFAESGRVWFAERRTNRDLIGVRF